MKLPIPEGRIPSAAAVFDAEHVLFSLGVERGGRRTNAFFLLGEDGRLIAKASGSPSDGRLFASVRGKALMSGRAVCTTGEGLMSVQVDAGRLVEGTLFGDTAPYVSVGVELLPGPGGSVYAVDPKEIIHLTLA